MKTKKIILEHRLKTTHLDVHQSRYELELEKKTINLELVSRIIFDKTIGQASWVWFQNTYLPNQGQYVC